MTTIAFDGKTLASDSQLTLGDLRLDSHTQKIFQPNAGESWYVNGERAVAFGVSGKLSAVQAVRKELASGVYGYRGLTTDSRFPKGDSFKYLVITEAGEVYAGGQYSDEETPWLARVSAPVAVGSGSEYAMGAMATGTSAEYAVEIASRFDINTGGAVQVLHPVKSPITG